MYRIRDIRTIRFSASIGKAKSKKTFNVSAIAAAALKNGIVLHYRACFLEGKRKILYVDTEQGNNHCQKVLDRILRLAGLPKDCDADNLTMLALRKYSYSISQELKELVKHNFKSEGEIRFSKQQFVSWVAIGVSLLLGILGVIF